MDRRYRGGLNVNIVDYSGVIWHDIIKVLRMLQGSDNHVACSLQDSNHPTLGPSARLGTAGFGPPWRHIATTPHHSAVAVHRGAGIFRSHENVGLVGLLRR